MTKKRSNIILVIILSATVGLLAGITGELITREYILKNAYNIPFFGGINLTGDHLNNPNIVIRGAKNITVEQNKRVKDTIESARDSVIGIYKEKKDKNEEIYYSPREAAFEGFVVTSDGWAISEIPANDALRADLLKNYIVITSDNKIYNIDEIKKSGNRNFVFLHLEDAEELPVKKISDEEDIEKGEVILAFDWEEKSFLTHISNKSLDKDNLILSSDKFNEEIILTDSLNPYFDNAFLFDLSGGIVGILDKNGNAQSINNFRNSINDFLDDKNRGAPVLGVNYIDLSQVVFKDIKREKGALIYPNLQGVSVKKGTPAEEAGLKKGDIITSVNNKKVDKNNSLSYIVQLFNPDETVNISYIRNGEEERAELKLQ